MKLLLTGLIAFCLVTPVFALDIEFNDVDSLLDYFANNSGFSGVVSYKQKGKLVEKSYGFSNQETQQLNTLNTKFLIGSNTKQFTAVAILQLVEQGEIQINQTVSTYLPEAPHGDMYTVENLLRHTSGLMNYTDLLAIWSNSTELKDPKEMIDLIQKFPLEFEPGSKFKYCNTGYLLLGMMIEKISGTTFENYIQQNILIPSKMYDSGYSPAEKPLDLAEGYDFDKNYNFVKPTVYQVSWAHAAGGMYSTIYDLRLWNKALSTPDVVLKESSLRLLKTPGNHDYAYGLFVNKIANINFIWHTGGIPGFTSFSGQSKDGEIEVIVLSNTFFGGYKIAGNLIKILSLGSTTISEKEVIELPENELKTFVGKFSCIENPELKARIFFDQGRLYFFLQGQPAFWLMPLNNTHFYLKIGGGVEIIFNASHTGNIEGFTLIQGNQSLQFKKIASHGLKINVSN